MLVFGPEFNLLCVAFSYSASVCFRAKCILIHRGYSDFLLNMAFISSSEVEIFIFHEWRSHE